MNRRLIATAAIGAAAGYALPRALAALRGPRRAALLSRMSAAIGDVLQPGEDVTYLSASARDRKGRLAVYAVGATDELAHLTWRGDVPEDARDLDGAP